VQTYTDARTLEEQVQATARRNLGRKLRTGDVSKFVALFAGHTGGSSKSTAAAKQERQFHASIKPGA
jgi:hypothetical protein